MAEVTLQKVLEEFIINIVEARKANLKVLHMNFIDIKPDITKEEIRKIIRTLRDYGYDIQLIKTILTIHPLNYRK